jgi:hypothetical protein
VRYFIGAQIDVSGLAKECIGLESLERLVNLETYSDKGNGSEEYQHVDVSRRDKKRSEFQDLCEMFDAQEQETVRKWGGRIHRDGEDGVLESNWTRPRLLLQENSPGSSKRNEHSVFSSGKLAGVYQNVGAQPLHISPEGRSDCINCWSLIMAVFACEALSISPNSIRITFSSGPWNSTVSLYEQDWWKHQGSG